MAEKTCPFLTKNVKRSAGSVCSCLHHETRKTCSDLAATYVSRLREEEEIESRLLLSAPKEREKERKKLRAFVFVVKGGKIDGNQRKEGSWVVFSWNASMTFDILGYYNYQNSFVLISPIENNIIHNFTIFKKKLLTLPFVIVFQYKELSSETHF